MIWGDKSLNDAVFSGGGRRLLMAMTTVVSARLTKRAAVHAPGPLGEITEKRHGQDGFPAAGL